MTLLPLAVASALALSAPAELLPPFQLATCAWRATDIVVATPVDAAAGSYEVAEAWAGDLAVGTRLTLRVLEADAGINSDHADWVDCGFLPR